MINNTSTTNILIYKVTFYYFLFNDRFDGNTDIRNINIKILTSANKNGRPITNLF